MSSVVGVNSLATGQCCEYQPEARVSDSWSIDGETAPAYVCVSGCLLVVQQCHHDLTTAGVRSSDKWTDSGGSDEGPGARPPVRNLPPLSPAYK